MPRSMHHRRFKSVETRGEARRRAVGAAVGCAVESLEGRQLFAVLTVNTLADTNAPDGFLSLREAIALIDSGGQDSAQSEFGRVIDPDESAQVDASTDPFGTNDRIFFDSSISGGTILIGSQITVSGAMVIDGGSAGVTLSGGASQAAWRAFYVNISGNLTLNDLTITNFSDRGTQSDPVNPPVDARGGAIWVDRGSLTLNGTTLSNNSAIGPTDLGDGWGGAAGRGGAIFVSSGSLSITGGTLDHNSAAGGAGSLNSAAGGGTGYGGAIYLEDTALTLAGVTLDHNSATGGAAPVGPGGSGLGGAIYGASRTVSVINGTLSDNAATGGDGDSPSGGTGSGGAVYIDSGTLTLTNSTLSRNTATGGDHGAGSGGAVYSMGAAASVTVAGSTLDHNAANGGDDAQVTGYVGGGYGGAIYNSSGALTVTGSTLSNNSVLGGAGGFLSLGAGYGGAIYNTAATLVLRDSTLDHNSATGGDNSVGTGGYGMGGAVYVTSSTLTVTNSTLASNSVVAGSGNTAGGWDDGTAQGGAIYAQDGNTAIDFSTISSNAAPDGGRGLYVYSSGGAAVVAISNSILGQADNGVTDLAFHGTVAASGSHNLIRYTVVAGVGNFSNADPRLAAFGDYGGGVGTFSLLPDSPALDAAGAAGGVTQDVRGASRDYNGTSDIGSFESQGYTLALDSGSTPQSAGVGQAFGNPLGVTLTENGFDAAIPGATITFTAPSSGASATVSTTATTDAGGEASVTPTANNVVGSYTVTASLGGPQDETADFSLDNTGTAPTISSANSVTFTVGSAGTFTITTTGTPTATLSGGGSLPSGITFVDNGDGTATLSGTPAGLTGGTYTLTFTASNGATPDATQTFTLTVDEAPAFTSANHVTITTGSAGTFTVTTSGFPSGALTKTGSLPSGITFTDNGDGTATFSGTAGAGAGGVYTVTLNADNGVGSVATQTFTLTVNAVGQAPAITSANRVTFTAGTAGSFLVVTNGSPLPAIHVVGTLPAGVTFVDNGDGTGTFSGTPTAPGVYPVSLSAGNSVGSDATQAFTITVNAQRPLVVASGQSTGGGGIQIKNPDGTTKLTITETIKRKAVRLAQADMNGDGVPDVITASGPGKKPQVTVYDGVTGQKIASLLAFPASARVGLFVAAADVNGDGTPDIITSQGTGARARIQVYSGVDQSLLADVAAPGMRGTVRVAAGDFNGDGYADIVIASGNGAAVKVLDGQAVFNHRVQVIASFSKADLGFSGGAFVATGDVDGDGTPDVIVAQSAGARPWVAAFGGADKSLITRFRATSSNGVRVASHDQNLDGFDDIVTSTTVKGRSVVSIFSGADGSLLDTFGNGKGKGMVFVA